MQAHPHIGEIIGFSIGETDAKEKARIVELTEAGAKIRVMTGPFRGMEVENAPLFPVEAEQ